MLYVDTREYIYSILPVTAQRAGQREARLNYEAR